MRKVGDDEEWSRRVGVAVETAVTNPKDDAYAAEVRAKSQVSVMEIYITYRDAERKAAKHALKIGRGEAAKHLLMGTHNNRRWLYRRGT